MNENVKKPKVRFKGYEDAWEQRKLSDLGEIMTGSTPSTSKEEYYSVDGIPWVTPTDINTQIISDTPRKLSEEGAKVGRVVPANTILCTCIASIGKNALLTVEGSFNQQINSLTPYTENNAYFLLTESEIWSDKMKKMAASGTMQIVNKTEFSELITMVPKTDEQKKIGDYFRTLDHLITLHQRECEQAKKYKKYMLQKMFPQNGSNVPEIRFSGFTYAWEQRKLPEFVTFYNGQTYTPDDVQESGTLVLRSSNVKNGEIVDADNVYINPEIASADNVQEGDIIVVVRNGSRALIGKHAQIKDPKPNTVIGAFMSGMRSEHSSFVNALLDTSAFENEIAKNMGATINQITGYMFSKMEFVIPTDDEQEKIGEYFANLDHLITIHQHKPIQQIIYISNQQFYNVYFGRRQQ